MLQVYNYATDSPNSVQACIFIYGKFWCLFSTPEYRQHELHKEAHIHATPDYVLHMFML